MNEINTKGLEKHLQDLAIKSARLLLEDPSIVTLTDEKSKSDFLTQVLDRQLINNGIRLYPINLFHNKHRDYYICQLVIDCSSFYTLREGYRDRGIYLEFCGVMFHTVDDGTFSVVPKSDHAANDLRNKVLSWLGFSKSIQTGNYLVDSRYEIESSSQEFAGMILNKDLIQSLSKSKEIAISIKDGAVCCDTGMKPNPNDMLLLKTILENISTGAKPVK